MMGHDIVNIYEDFYKGEANLETIDLANIALIPKVELLECPINFGPISFINSCFKIILKFKSIWLSRVVDNLVDTTQTSFIKGECMMAIANELNLGFKSAWFLDTLLKLILFKLSIRWNWYFLLEVMEARGFRPH